MERVGFRQGIWAGFQQRCCRSFASASGFHTAQVCRRSLVEKSQWLQIVTSMQLARSYIPRADGFWRGGKASYATMKGWIGL
jgi:hypothetical protein